MIEIKNLKRTYTKGDVSLDILKGISFQVPEGTFAVIVGKSGSGKSTLLNLLGALDKPSSGEIIFNGKDIGKLSKKEQAHHRKDAIGFVFQSFNLIPSYTALENVMLAMAFSNKSVKEKTERAKHLLDKVGLSHRYDHKPGEMSGGENQRVAIARALINNPPVILADEPTGNLDSNTSNQIMVLLKELHNEGKTIVMITHDKDLANEYAQQLITIHDGELI